MAQRDLLSGFLAGMGLMTLAYGLISLLFDSRFMLFWDYAGLRALDDSFGARTQMIIGIAVNIVLVNFFKNQYMTGRMRGAIMATFAGTLFWLWCWYDLLF